MYDVAAKNRGRQMQDVISEILLLSKLEDIQVNNRITICLDRKIRRLLKKGKEAKRQGGRTFKVFTGKLKARPYRIKIYVHETSKIELSLKVKQLASEKQMLEEDLSRSVKEQKKLEQNVNFWRNKYRTLVKKHSLMQKRAAERRKQISSGNCSQHNKYTIRNKLWFGW